MHLSVSGLNIFLLYEFLKIRFERYPSLRQNDNVRLSVRVFMCDNE